MKKRRYEEILGDIERKVEYLDVAEAKKTKDGLM